MAYIDTGKYVTLENIEPLQDKAVLEEEIKSLQDWVWEAYKKALKEEIKANTILIDKHFAKTNRIFVNNLDIPPMICGLEIKLTEELPEGYSFALIEAPETEREHLIEKARQEVAREIFEEIEKILIDSAYIPDCARFVDIDKLAELKKKYTEG